MDTRLRTIKRIMVGLGALVALGGVEASSHAAPRATASRYPYDPVCEWGRLADGRGMLIRCLTRAEAASLKGVGSTASAPTAPSAPGGTPAAPSSSSGAKQKLAVTVGPVHAEHGQLPEAVRKLKRAEERFRTCVADNGGLTRKQGEVQVRFLVRERGRAEGVSVAKRRSLSAAAAKCVADVVDRRSVGLPEAPIVAATLVVKFEQLSQ
jgi:hypothetical protein